MRVSMSASVITWPDARYARFCGCSVASVLPSRDTSIVATVAS
jgi:hypothetical protein